MDGKYFRATRSSVRIETLYIDGDHVNGGGLVKERQSSLSSTNDVISGLRGGDDDDASSTDQDRILLPVV